MKFLRSIFSKKQRTTDRIINVVADVMELDYPNIILEKRRDQNIADARHMVCYILREREQQTFMQIAENMKLNHSSAIHGFRKIKNMKESNKIIKEKLDTCLKILYVCEK